MINILVHFLPENFSRNILHRGKNAFFKKKKLYIIAEAFLMKIKILHILF